MMGEWIKYDGTNRPDNDEPVRIREGCGWESDCFLPSIEWDWIDESGGAFCGAKTVKVPYFDNPTSLRVNRSLRTASTISHGDFRTAPTFRLLPMSRVFILVPWRQYGPRYKRQHLS